MRSNETGWTTPGYILDGIKWLAESDIPDLDPELVVVRSDRHAHTGGGRRQIALMLRADEPRRGSQRTGACRAVLPALNVVKAFVLEAGAGAGKTYSLVKALRFL